MRAPGEHFGRERGSLTAEHIGCTQWMSKARQLDGLIADLDAHQRATGRQTKIPKRRKCVVRDLPLGTGRIRLRICKPHLRIDREKETRSESMRGPEQAAQVHRLGDALHAGSKISSHFSARCLKTAPKEEKPKQPSGGDPIMANPILVELTRGSRVESVHRGAIAIADAGGGLRCTIGDIQTPIYPRSSLKPIQALPLVESGALDAFGLADEHVALACASHSGEPMHTMRVAAWLERLGLSESDLACGPHPVRHEPTWFAMVGRGENATRIHNNCSGKHTGFLTVARHWDVATAGYAAVDHPVQQAVRASLADLSGETDLPFGIDGCAAPNFALPLAAFAQALAKLAEPTRLPETRARAAKRIVSAMIQYPELVSGTGRACAILMRASNGRAAVKAGAEGFYAGIVPELGIGIALKIDDGAGRASETVIAAILARLSLTGEDRAARALVSGIVTNTRGDVVGERRVTATLDGIHS